MRNFLLMGAAAIMISSCTNVPSEQEARSIISADLGANYVAEYYFADPHDIPRLFGSDAEKQGLISFDKRPTIGSIVNGNPLVTFSAKASTYIDSIASNSSIAYIIVARANISDIKIETEHDGNQQEVTVHYKLIYTDPTPFAALSPGLIGRLFSRKAKLEKVAGKWKIKRDH
ncbi:hypothetical protein [Pedobacter paludis]|uniref:Uncharacterized protein n=1 Tax=Pedobacter paludis TaxID=2203212 RepID=A0A317F1S3_9SPHI|nr:hypothetical protein [Pedobacter paludis]PWS32213.1 hypothetical protein DF947_10615 [Pedobacter paludis]